MPALWQLQVAQADTLKNKYSAQLKQLTQEVEDLKVKKLADVTEREHKVSEREQAVALFEKDVKTRFEVASKLQDQNAKDKLQLDQKWEEMTTRERAAQAFYEKYHLKLDQLRNLINV